MHPHIHPITPESRNAIELELAAILQSRYFRRSSRSCAFLRFVVQSTLDGRTDLLKERSVGVAVFGRDAAYDTGSDAAVRVRAVDVRKRLESHYSSGHKPERWRIGLRSGSYRPQFDPVVNAGSVDSFGEGSYSGSSSI